LSDDGGGQNTFHHQLALPSGTGQKVLCHSTSVVSCHSHETIKIFHRFRALVKTIPHKCCMYSVFQHRICHTLHQVLVSLVVRFSVSWVMKFWARHWASFFVRIQNFQNFHTEIFWEILKVNCWTRMLLFWLRPY
jgi:hypothetical protein